MKLFVLYIVLYFCVSDLLARKRHRLYRQRQNESIEDISWNLDLRGNLRKHFYLISSLYNTSENVICSPLSALMPIGKLALGAVGNSLDELLSAIGVSSKQKLRQHFKPLIAEMCYLPGVKLDVASNVYVSKTTRLRRDFRNNAKDIFQTSVDRVDFSTPKETAKLINDWVSKQTGGKIKDMIKTSDISSSTPIIIVNAVYFRGKWEESFKNAGLGHFHSGHGRTNITMMTRTGLFNYTKSEALDSRIIKIPYTGGKSYFLIVLPNKLKGLPDVLNLLKSKPDILDLALTKMRPAFLNLKLPIFKIEAKLNLKNLYKEIGVKKIFSSKSGLDDMIRNGTVVVSRAKQKAYIEVNEEGTLASAASATDVVVSTLHGDFHVNHPFLFFIIVEKQQLFAGTFVNSLPKNHLNI